MKPSIPRSIHRPLKLEVETLKTLTSAELALVGGGDDTVAKTRLSWARCPRP